MEFGRGEMGSESLEGNGEAIVETASLSRVKFCHDIPDWLLVEVLLRLPVKLVFRFKLVSKQWLAVVLDPSFIRMYISRASMSPPLQNWTFLSCGMYVDGYHYSDYPEYELLEDIYSPDLKCPSLHVLRCPFSVDPRVKKYRIVGASDGLVLYVPRVKVPCCCIYNICNPVTRQWISLPPYARDFEFNCIGFITRVENGVLSSYRVVRLELLLARSNVIRFELFLSELNEWKNFDVYADRAIEFTQRNPTSFNGILHWTTQAHGILAYDPYQEPGAVRFIALPGDIDPTSNDEQHDGIPGLCDATQGSLRYFEVSGVFMPPHGFSNFSLWILNDYGTGDWCLQHRISSTDIIYDGILFARRLFIEPVSFHPFDPELVYLGYEGMIVSYNIKTSKLEVLGGPHNDTVTHWQKQPSWLFVLLYVAPLWPTSITAPSFGVS